MGGMVAQHVAAMAKPDALRAFVLLSIAQKASPRSAEILRLRRDMVLAGADQSLIYRDQFLWAKQEQSFAQEGAVQGRLEYLAKNPTQQSTAGFSAQANACGGHDGDLRANRLMCLCQYL
jgi:hypothetical protein